jgi:hypothetical protein
MHFDTGAPKAPADATKTLEDWGCGWNKNADQAVAMEPGTEFLWLFRFPSASRDPPQAMPGRQEQHQVTAEDPNTAREAAKLARPGVLAAMRMSSASIAAGRGTPIESIKPSSNTPHGPHATRTAVILASRSLMDTSWLVPSSESKEPSGRLFV